MVQALKVNSRDSFSDVFSGKGEGRSESDKTVCAFTKPVKEADSNLSVDVKSRKTAVVRGHKETGGGSLSGTVSTNSESSTDRIPDIDGTTDFGLSDFVARICSDKDDLSADIELLKVKSNPAYYIGLFCADLSVIFEQLSADPNIDFKKLPGGLPAVFKQLSAALPFIF